MLKITGIICEYNPLHLGHKKQIDRIRAAVPDGLIVCLMSGNYVQRGFPAIVDKSLRAKAAILAGADLVLELPITAALSSAEGFAAEGVRILSHFCTHLCFGAETADTTGLMQTAKALLSDAFSERLRIHLDQGFLSRRPGQGAGRTGHPGLYEAQRYSGRGVLQSHSGTKFSFDSHAYSAGRRLP